MFVAFAATVSFIRDLVMESTEWRLSLIKQQQYVLDSVRTFPMDSLNEMDTIAIFILQMEALERGNIPEATTKSRQKWDLSLGRMALESLFFLIIMV